MSSLRAFLFLCFGLFLGGFSVFAFAAASDYGRSMNLNYPNSGQARPPGWYSAPRYDFANAGAGWGKMRDINTISIGGRHFDVTGGRLFSPQTLAKGAVSFVRFGGPAWLGFMLAGLIWDEVSRRWLWPDESQAWDEHAGLWRSQAAPGAHRCSVFEDACGMTEAATQYLEWVVPLQNAPGTTFRIVNITVAGDLATVKYVTTRNGVDTTKWTSVVRQTASTQCPSGMTYANGVCSGAGQVVTDEELEDAIYAELVARGMGSELARRLIEAGYHPPVDGIEIDGPSSIPGDSVTSTTSGPAGTTSTTTNTTHNISYTTNTTNNTSTVTISNVTTTTTTAPDGTTTTETTESAPEGQTEPPPEEKPFCELYPDASACAKLDVPATDPNESEDVTVTLTPTGGFGSEAGSCPPPFPFVVQGRSYQISYAQACDFFSAVRPVVIAAAMLSALLIALGGYKRD